ncbi:MAG: dTMP kinase [Rikenellaceae bacterium]
MLIVLEGLDGAGKSTQIKMLSEIFKGRGMECEYLHFPRFTAPLYGELIAKFLRGELGALDQVDPHLVALIYAGDRGDAASIIRGWLDEGKVVILDRYVYSNVGYQCGKVESREERKELAEWILDMEYNHFGIPRPDISLFLDVPFQFTKDRLAEQREGEDREYLKGKKDIHESSLDLQIRVRDSYLLAAESDPQLKIVDCSTEDGEMGSPEVIFSRIMEYVK